MKAIIPNRQNVWHIDYAARYLRPLLACGGQSMADRAHTEWIFHVDYRPPVTQMLIIQGRHDLYDLAHVSGWKQHNMHDLAHVSWVGSVPRTVQILYNTS